MLKSCDKGNICTIHNIATPETIDVATKTIEKEQYCIPVRNTTICRIKINTLM